MVLSKFFVAFLQFSGIVCLNTMSAIAGYLNNLTADSENLVGEYQETVTRRHAKGRNSGAVLFSLMSMLATEPADNSEFNWWEQDPVSRVVLSSAATANTTGTTLGFDDGAAGSVSALLNAGTILWNARTNEYVQVVADATNTAAVVVVRGACGTTAANIDDNDTWTVVTSALSDGTQSIRAQYEAPGLVKNYIQHFGRAISMTRRFKGEVVRQDNNGPLREARITQLENIGVDIELAFLFGQPSVRTENGDLIYTTGGVKAAVDAAGISSNILNGAGSTGVTLDAFNTWTESVLRYGSDGKLLLCGPGVYTAISKWANTNSGGYRTESTNRVFGMNIVSIQTPSGEIGLVHHPLFKHYPTLNNWGVVVDLENIVQKIYNPLDLEQNVQTPGAFQYKEQFTADLGLKVKAAQTHGYVYNLTNIKAS
jgi:hypothetical protein